MNAVPVSKVSESPSNPRKNFGDLAELAASMRALGVLQPILVRPLDGKGGDAMYECVCGHRRLRAAKLIGLEEIPANVRDLSDAETLEAQLVENACRQDLHPLEEGAAYHELHEKCGYSVDEIAAKTGKSTATIYARMKLCALCDSARKVVLEGKLDASLALLIARIPSEKLQAEATKTLVDGYDGEPYSYRRAAELVQERFMLRLGEAQFDKNDAELVAGAGPCSRCTKRTGAQPELFPDVKSGDVCTDTLCFGAKRDAAWKIRTHEAKASGKAVLSDKEAKALYPYGNMMLAYNAGYVDLDEKQHLCGRETTYRAIAKKAGKELEVTLARDPRGNIHDLASRKAADAIVRKERKEPEPEDEEPLGGSRSDETAHAENEKWKKQHELEQAVSVATQAALVEAVERKGMNDAWWLLLFGYVIDGADVARVALRRGYVESDEDPDLAEKQAREAFAGGTGQQRAALLLELLLTGAIGYLAPDTKAAMAAYDVDAKAIEAKVKAEQKAAAKAEAKGKKGAKKS